jgi:hypothetical protein
VNDEFRVEVELDDAERGYSLGERLRALDLDDAARERLGAGVMVTRDGSRLFLYAASDSEAREAEQTIRELVEADELTAAIAVTRWHEVEEAWKDSSLPLPATSVEEQVEQAALEASEAREAELEGRYDWEVVVQLPSRSLAIDIARRLTEEGQPVRRRWRYVAVGAPTEDRARELAERLRSELPDDAEIGVEVDLSDVERSPLQFLPF